MVMLLVFHDQRHIFCCICLLLFAMFKPVLPDMKICPLATPLSNEDCNQSHLLSLAFVILNASMSCLGNCLCI